MCGEERRWRVGGRRKGREIDKEKEEYRVFVLCIWFYN